MANAELQEVIRLAGQFNLVPIARTLMADTETPIRVFQQFYEEPYAFLLESAEGGVNLARYSFIGTDPFLIIRGKNGRFTVEYKDGTKEIAEGNPIEVLRRLFAAYRSPALPDLPRFTGGAVGFFGYDLLRYYEQIPSHRRDDLNMQDIEFMFCDQVIAFDHVKHQIKVIANVHIPEGADEDAIRRSYEQTVSSIERTVKRLQSTRHQEGLPVHELPADIELGEITSNVSEEQFMTNVEKAKGYIRSGEVQQVVLSQRFEMQTEISPLQVYRVLRMINPSPYMYVLKLCDEVIVGASPELLVRVEGDRVATRPIAGTRPRGAEEEEDLRLEQELLADEKERAEHQMLVDLGREDLERVSEEGSVKCDSFMEIERYSHVMHIVSHLSGKLREGKDFFDAFIACLPAGTVSGAPRIRAMEIIAELEQEARGAYAGSIGYLGFSGNLDSCITIRTIIFKNGKAYVQAGAGIVEDSNPKREYEETVNKAAALLKAIRMAETVFQQVPQ
ncbi:anthranilate synthase component I [Insulibacter thermoxylanivorax]|uniref:Anthranilate synthase component 1 n=1 Tax=Insulibacter thermoxylanivorax TaxID=2749268 RepID=A0A916VF14_9BACL|nr:anthranilate synthase component I [Insulibacter thermoxylanivorax]GFR36891.1 anthranilate synthase component I [Insulibacter thermoxylanivorax]